jgi:hypothetical protein
MAARTVGHCAGSEWKGERHVRRLLVMLLLVAGIGTASHTSVRAQTGTDPATFALQTLDFPAPATVLTSRVETNDLATQEKTVTHFGATFATESRITGYFMEVGQANVEASGVLHPVVTSYLVSQFPSTDLAAAAFGQERDGWEDTILHPANGISATVTDLQGEQFGELAARGLYVATTTTASGPAVVSELLFKRGVYLVEVFQSYYSKDATPYGASAQPFVLSIGHKLDAIAGGTGQIVPPTPVAKPDFAILKVRVEKNGAKADLKKPALSKAKAGTLLRFSAYFTVKNPAPDHSITTDFRLSLNGQSTHHSFTKTLVSGPALYYRYSIHGVKLTVLGTYTVTGTITMGGVSHAGSTTITIVASKAIRIRERPLARMWDRIVSSLQPGQGVSRSLVLETMHPRGAVTGMP